MKTPRQFAKLMPGVRRSLLRLLFIICGAQSICLASTVATPTFSPAAGTYTSIQTVTISDSTSGATIYYTTNGSTPTTSSTQYTGAITVSSTETVKAIGTKTGYTQSAVGSAAYTINLTAATPTFSPAAGTYTSIQTVTISDSTPSSTIYYTTNGSTPTTSSTHYTGGITVSASETVKAIATATGYAQSAVGSAAYTINLTAATPTFSPAAGTYTSIQTVTISDSTPSSTIYYTTNGSTPTTSSTQYTGGITVSASETVKAIATATGYAQSAVGSAAYTITLPAATPTFSPVAGTYTTSQTVTISDSTSGSTIYYTTNGTTPTTSSTKYTSAITVSSTETVEAIATASGYSQSAVGSAAYTINLTAATPTFSPVAGTYTSTQTVTISDSTSGSTIYYTTNGSTPTTSSTQYTGGIPVSSSETIKAIATATGYAQSAVGSAAYTINLTSATPTFSPVAGTYTSSQTVTISDSTSGSTIYYTSNGTTPSTSSTVYTGPVNVNSTETLEAMATASGYANSSVGTAAYTIQVATPGFSPVAGTYGTPQTVTITDSTSGSTIYYTTNGSTPTTSSTVYSGPISVNSDETLKAIATASGDSQSAIGTAAYNIMAATPSFSISAGSYVGTQTLTLSDSTSSRATIYYTTNGTTPTTSSTKYTSAISVSSSETVEAIATVSGYAQSAVGSAAYTITSVPAVPTFSPVAGSYPGAQLVTINDSSSEVTIYYTTNGSTPTTSSTVFTGAITVGSTETIKAIASVSGYSPSAVATATYTLPAQAASTTSLAITSGGSPVSSVASGSLVTLTATTTAGGATVTKGTVNFCDATVTYCTDVHLLGTAQLTSAGTATINLRPGIGNHSYKAIMAGTSSDLTSSSGSVPLNVTGTYPSASTIAASETVNNYTLTATVTSTKSNNNAPTGTVSFLDTTDSNAVLGTSTLSTPALSFSNAPTFATGNTPGSIALGDVNGDGIVDMVVPSGVEDGTVSVLLGNGDGTFSAATNSPFAAGYYPGFIAEGDFNGDGKPDLAAVSFTGSSITIFLGNGDGTFSMAPNSPINGTSAGSVVTGDFNQDGKLDLAMLDSATNTLEILLGNGDGTFTAAASSPVSLVQSSGAIAVGDFNGDGKPDLAITNLSYNSVTILLGNGDGTFSNAPNSPVAVGSEPDSIVVGDFNGDGRLDLAVANEDGGSVSILLGNGDGTFTPVTNSPDGLGFPTEVAMGDFNGDGIPDLAVLEGNTAAILLGVGDGTFTNNSQNGSINVGVGVGALAVGNFNEDGFSDLAVVNEGPNTGSIFLSDWSGVASVTDIFISDGSTHNVDASYSGDTNYAASTSGTTPLTGPRIIHLSPVVAPIGSIVAVGGQNFGTSGTVMFNGIPASPTSWGIDTIITTVPVGASSGPVVVTNSNGAISNGYSFQVAAGIAGVSPGQGNAGTVVTISGTGFGSTQGTSTVTFNGVSATPSSWNNETIVVPVPTEATTGNVAVLVGGVTSPGPVFVVLPSIVGLSPSAGPVGTVVTVSGANFGLSQGISSIAFGQVIGVPTQWMQDTIIVPVPQGAVTGPVVVMVSGQASNAVQFTVSNSSSSGSGSISGTVTQSNGITPISGATVTVLNGSNTVASVTTGTSGTYLAPNVNAGTYNLQAAGFGFGAASQAGIAVTAGQQTVANFDLSTQPTITYTYDEDGRLVGVSSPNLGSAQYSYDAVGNILSISSTNSGQVSILNFNPLSGPVGTGVTIYGSSFNTNSQQDTVKFGTTVASVTSATANQLVVTVPTGAITAPISVTTPVGSATSTQSFTVGSNTSLPSITSFSPGVGAAGDYVQIFGSGFASLADDVVEFGGSTAYLTSASPATIWAVVPQSADSGPISVTTPLGDAVSSTDFFVVPSGFAASQVDFTDVISVGSGPYTGTIINGGDIGLVLFNATAGQTFNLMVNGSSISSATISILGPGGSTLESATIATSGVVLDSLTVSTTGTYTVLVASNGSSSTGNLVFTLSQGTSANVTGTTATGNIEVDTTGQTGTVELNGTAGQQVGVLLASATFPGSCYSAIVSVLTPNNSTLTSGSMCGQGRFFLGPVTLPSSGTYTVLIAPQNGGTGGASVTISQFSPLTIPVTAVNPGTTGTLLSINTPGQYAQMSFSGTAGQSATVQLSNSTFPGACSSVVASILNPDNSTLSTNNMCGQGSFSLGPVSLPTNGTYTVVIAPQSGGTGAANMNLTVQ